MIIIIIIIIGIEIAKLIRYNTSLIELSITHVDEIDKMGCDAIARAMEINTTFKELVFTIRQNNNGGSSSSNSDDNTITNGKDFSLAIGNMLKNNNTLESGAIL